MEFSLRDCLTTLREDLIETIKEGRDKEVKFVVEDISVELQIFAGQSDSIGGGIKWWVLSADGDTTRDSRITQKLNLSLKVEDAAGRNLRLSDGG